MVNQSWEDATFMDMGSAPATLDAARACDFLGCAPGNDGQQADAIQAYVQADMKGRTWICLPPEARPDDWEGKYDWPVVPMHKALYGHPDSGTIWEEHCDGIVQKTGFVPIGPEWPSCYVHQ